MAESIFKCSQTPAADVNATRLSVAKVCEPVSGTPWTVQQPNEISSYSADITKTQRTPIRNESWFKTLTIHNYHRRSYPGHSSRIPLF